MKIQTKKDREIADLRAEKNAAVADANQTRIQLREVTQERDRLRARIDNAAAALAGRSLAAREQPGGGGGAGGMHVFVGEGGIGGRS